jgi:hypothetical protein
MCAIHSFPQATGLGVYYGVRSFLEFEEVQQKTGLSVCRVP